MPKRQPILSEDGTYYSLPIGKDAKDGYAIVDKEDLKFFGPYTNWRIVGAGYVGFEVDGKTIYCQQVIARPSALETVCLKDGDKKNLRRSNLELRAKDASAANAEMLRDNRSTSYDTGTGEFAGLPITATEPSPYIKYMDLKENPVTKSEILGWINREIHSLRTTLRNKGKTKGAIQLLTIKKRRELLKKYRLYDTVD